VNFIIIIIYLFSIDSFVLYLTLFFCVLFVVSKKKVKIKNYFISFFYLFDFYEPLKSSEKKSTRELRTIETNIQRHI